MSVAPPPVLDASIGAMHPDDPRRFRRAIHHAATALIASVLYVLSSGPVLGLAFWLREATGRDGFYAVMWLYWPLLKVMHSTPLGSYIEWWVVSVFRTVGPG
jgi:hypothetical protein